MQQGEGNRSFRQERLDGTLLRTIRVNRVFEKRANWGWTTHGLRSLLGKHDILEDLEASRYTTRCVTNGEGYGAQKAPRHRDTVARDVKERRSGSGRIDALWIRCTGNRGVLSMGP